MFQSGMKESTNGVVNVGDTDEVVFQEMLKYIYHSQCDEAALEANTEGLFAVAEKVGEYVHLKGNRYFRV